MWLFWLCLRESTKGLFRNILMNSFALMLSIVCFSMLAFFTIIGINTKYISSVQEEKIQIVLNLNDNVTNYLEIENKLTQMPEVKSVSFTSKDEAYQEMKQSLGKRQDMLTGLGFNPLPASFNIKLKNPRDVEKVVKTIQSWGVDKDIKYGEEFLNNFFKVTDQINQLAFWIIIIMSVATGAVIYSSIRMNILNRNKEIEIKDLIGAGQINIRVPFMMEAVLLTVISATLVIVFVFLFYNDLIYLLLKGMPIGEFMSRNQVIKSLIPPMYAVATVIALVSSFLSTQRYLKRH